MWIQISSGKGPDECELALSRLSNLIKAKNEEGFSNHKRSMWVQHNTLERGNPLRIYEGKEFRIKQI